MEEIIQYLIDHKQEILFEKQFKYCVACHGPKLYDVFRSPACYELGALLEKYENGLRSS